MKIDIGPGEAAVVMPVEVWEHICMTYNILGEEETRYENKLKWNSIAEDIEKWLQWSLEHYRES